MITLIATCGASMSSITIRKLDPAVKERLRVRAAEHGHSMEAEARSILQNALGHAPSDMPLKRTGADLIARIRTRFEPLGFVNLELPPRDFPREPPKFD
ncbi:MAG TPA: plasmid stabilization protein [Stellaceae bacterium]|jgi:plasmid stability protein|nr:plasmid stabilization protein [Stellaceae bacterium]